MPLSDEVRDALDIIDTQVAAFLPHDDRVASACRTLRAQVPGTVACSAIPWLPRLLPLPAQRVGTVIAPIFDLLEAIAAGARDPWPVIAAMLAARDSALQRRALDALVRACASGVLRLTPEITGTLADRVDDEGSAIADDAAVQQVGLVLDATAAESLFEHGGTWNARRLGARVLDLGGSPPDPALMARILGAGAIAMLGRYLAFTRATHQDVLDIQPLAADPAALDSFRRAEQVCGRRTLREVVAALGWRRLNLGIEVHPLVGVSVSGGFPLVLAPVEARLFDGCPDVRRAFDRTLVVAVGARPEDSRVAAKSDAVTRFRAYNVVHAEVLADILDVAPLDRSKLRRILTRMDRLVEDFAALFGGTADRGSRDEAAALVRVHADLAARIDRALAGTSADLLPLDVCRLVQPFEDPTAPHEIRTLHGLKRYLHQRGLKLAFGLIGAGPRSTKTIDLAVVNLGRDIRVGRHIEFVDLEGQPRPGVRPDIPSAVRRLVEAFGHQLIHQQKIPSDVRVFCYGNEVHYFARFRNHPAFIRIDDSPPLRGGMVDLQYAGVSINELSNHPCPALDAIRRFFDRLDFMVSVDATRIQARYDKERTLTAEDLHGRAALLLNLVPYLMDVDWAIGSLRLPDDARARVAEAWADFFARWGVLPYDQFVTVDRSGVLAGIEAGAEGVREVRWAGEPPYCDRFTRDPSEAALAALSDTVASLGLELSAPLRADDLRGQVEFDRRVRAALRGALGRGEIADSPDGLRRRPPALFEREHEVHRLRTLLDESPDAIARAARLARTVALLDRQVRFQTTGRINGYDVQQARVSLGATGLTVFVLRDGSGMPRLACAATDPCLWRRRPSEDAPWTRSSDCDVDEVQQWLRSANVLGTAPEMGIDDDQALAHELRRLFEMPHPVTRPPALSNERSLDGISASPGRAAGLARFGGGRRRPEELAGSVFMAAHLEPADAPYLSSSAAIVATGGGILSHLGLLAVEAGTPAIIVDGAWTTTASGEAALAFRIDRHETRETAQGDFHLVEYHHRRQIDDLIRDGDLVVVDADAGMLTVLGHDPVTLSVHDSLGQHVEASRSLRDAGPDEVLVQRGHYLRTRHQLEKAIGRVTDVPLARYAIEEILLNRAWSQTADAARDGIEMLRRLAQNAAVGDGVLAVVRHVTARLAARAREAREQAARLIPSSWTAHDVLALRLQSLHVHHVLDRVSASLASAGLDTCVVMAGGHAEVDRLAYEQLTTLHQQLRDSEPAPARAGGHVSRLAQRRRLDALLSATPWHDEDGDIRTSAATTSAQGRATPLVVGPHDIDADITALAGAKAGNLADAARVVGESAIPEWFAVTRHAFHEAVDAGARHDIEAILADAALGPDAQSSAIRELFRRLALPQRLVQAVAEAYRAMGSDVYVAVRSSALDEDTECSTRAGQFETFLFVRGAQAVTEHLALAWGGFWTARAIADRLVRHDTACPSGGIVIQRMVQSRVSGVMQTINVAGAHPREIVINAGLGLGEGIVSGRVAADHIVVAKDPPGSGALRFRYVTADKRERVVFDERLGRGTVRVDTLAHQRLRPVLEYPEVCALVETALRLEAAYGQPVDIEFGFEGPDLRVLQVRPLPSTAAVWRETMERFPLLSPGRREEARDDSP